jgi:pSer/pThr/pTyr-binding forkhead associated (FHA) protein
LRHSLKKPVVLRIFKGDQLLGIKQFFDPQIVIGREGEVHVALESPTVSIIHASIEERGHEYFVADFGSASGTFRNGERVLESVIESGDTLQFGEFRIEFYIGVPKPKTEGTTVTQVAPPPPPAQAAPPQPPPVAPQAPVAPPPIIAAPPASPQPPTPPAPPQSPATAKKTETETTVASGMVGGMATNQTLAGPKPGGPTRPKGRAGSPPTKKKVKGKTFAPPSKHSSIRDVIKPTKGTVVEVLVAWKERVISTHHFSKAKTITMGSHPGNDVVLPMFSMKVRKLPVVKIGSQATIMVLPEMRGELIRGQSSSSFSELMRQNRMNKTGAMFTLALEQGEMVQLEVSDEVSVFVRYVSDSPKPLVAPLLDLTASEVTGVILSLALVASLWLYMYLHTPPKALPEIGTEEPMRIAKFMLATPTPAPLPPPEPVVQAPEPPPPPPEPVRVKVVETKQEEKPKAESKKAVTVTNLTTKNDPGKSSNAAPNKNTTGPRQLTSPKQGGAIKTSDKEGSQMQSRNRDVSKSGVFSVFGSGGAQDQLAQSTTGSGELAGLAAASSGKAGSAVNRPGQGLGSELKDTGRGGTGRSLEGIAGGVGTQGRGSGVSGVGEGGIGNRAGVKIVTGGSEESIGVGIDKEAIRRVILANLRVIRTCYERQLNRRPDLFGKLVIGWDIGEQGRVVAAKVKSNELGSKEVADCIIERLKTWKFPEPPTNQIVEVEAYPFFFSN